MATFRIIALRILEGCPEHFRRVLDEKKTYFFDERYEDVEETDFIRKVVADDDELRLYDVKGYEDRTIHVEVSAVVGKNGEGKSTLIELIIRVLNNFACHVGFRATQETLRYVKGLRVALFYEVNNIIYCIRCDDHDISWFEGRTEIGVIQGTPDVRLNELISYHREQLFYTLVINYALYSYNSNVFAYETSGKGCWLDGLFHKNDSYQTPLVLNPMRTNGIINVNKELDLSKQRLMTIFTDAGDCQERRVVSNGVEAYGFAFSLDKSIKLLDVTLRDYFDVVVDDECRMRDTLESSDPVEVAKDMLPYFKGFFSSFNSLLDKNDYIFKWLTSYEVDHPIKHSYTDLARYVDIIAQAYEEMDDDYTFCLEEDLRHFLPNGSLRWLNYAQLYRLLFVFAIWEVLREIDSVEFDDTIDTYLEEPNNPTNKAILYIPYKIVEILSTYDPYRKKDYLYDSTCESLKYVWPSEDIKGALRQDIENILRKDDYTTLKLRQAINYLKEQRGGMYEANRIEPTPEGYEWFVSFSKLKSVIRGEDMRLSELVKHLPPPVFKGEIELKNDVGNTYALSTLSSGQMQRLNSAGALVYHLRNLDYRLKQLERLEYDYVTVIFEEVELYFHPEYQRTLIQYLLTQIEQARLKNIKGIQLIYVTHSPFILTDMLDRNVMYLSKEGKPRPDKRTFAANIYDLLDDHFFLDETVGDVALQKLQTLVSLYHDQRYEHRGLKFLQLEPEFRKLKDQIADNYLREDYSRMYYELLATYMRGKLNEEIAKAEQHVEELRALANRNHRE